MATDLIQFTEPDGGHVYISAGSVVSVAKSRPEHGPLAHAVIMGGGGPHAVRETVEQVLALVRVG